MWPRAGSSARHVVRAVRNCPPPPGAWWWVMGCGCRHVVPIPTPGPLDTVLIWGLCLILVLPAGDLSAQDGPWPPPGWPGSCTVRWRVVVPPAGRAWPCWARPRATSHTHPGLSSCPSVTLRCHLQRTDACAMGNVQKQTFRRSLKWV